MGYRNRCARLSVRPRIYIIALGGAQYQAASLANGRTGSRNYRRLNGNGIRKNGHIDRVGIVAGTSIRGNGLYPVLPAFRHLDAVAHGACGPTIDPGAAGCPQCNDLSTASLWRLVSCNSGRGRNSIESNCDGAGRRPLASQRVCYSHSVCPRRSHGDLSPGSPVGPKISRMPFGGR